MDPSMGKGCAPIREPFLQQSQSPLRSPVQDIEEFCPLSDTHLDQSATFPFETVSGRPANNCSKPVSGWPSQVTITTVPFSNVYMQPTNYSPDPPTPEHLSPPMSLPPNPPGRLSITPNLLLGASQQIDPQSQICPEVATNCMSAVDGVASSPAFNVIQPLCYGPVSEGHYIVLQPLCCYLTKEPSEHKESEEKAVLQKKEEVEKKEDEGKEEERQQQQPPQVQEEIGKGKIETSKRAENKKTAKRKSKVNRKSRAQNGKHNSSPTTVRSKVPTSGSRSLAPTFVSKYQEPRAAQVTLKLLTLHAVLCLLVD